ncbi:hypothetical protein B7R77_25405 [Ralstonia solanacearum K60]|uniref:Uncharacterized protein n=1 Tax=Ralstonia solanacearum K60 TaxID=1091042 RepID=A0AAP7ZJ73_RALSL|nr:hypothetical protein B7R77_25405 [Ralstonia solanacearum K60]RIJ83868.1 hypothetical protein RSP822_24450 [Ralstonia solanacearum]
MLLLGCWVFSDRRLAGLWVTRWAFLPDLRFLCLSCREVERTFGAGENASGVNPQSSTCPPGQ